MLIFCFLKQNAKTLVADAEFKLQKEEDKYISSLRN